MNTHEVLSHTVSAWRATALFGYLDPGTGSYAYQMVIAGLTGVLFFFSSIKRKVLSIFTKGAPEPGRSEILPMKDAEEREPKDQSVAG